MGTPLKDYVLLEGRIFRIEEAQAAQSEKIAVNEAESHASFSGIKDDLVRIEEKVDKISDTVSSHHDLWVAAQTKEKTKKSWGNALIAILGVIACSGILEFALRMFFK